MSRLVGMVAGDGLAAAAAPGSVRSGMDRHRVSPRLQPRAFDGRPARRANAVSAVRRPGARGGCGARAPATATISRRPGTGGDCLRHSLSVAHAGVAR